MGTSNKFDYILGLTLLITEYVDLLERLQSHTLLTKTNKLSKKILIIIGIAIL